MLALICYLGTLFTLKGEYTYIPPAITMDVEGILPPDDSPGKVDDDTLTIGVFETLDTVSIMEFQKQ